MNTWQAIKAFFGFPPTTPPSAAVTGETPPEEALRSYVRSPYKRRLAARIPRTTGTPASAPQEDHTLRDVAIGVAVGSALGHSFAHSDDAYSSSSSSSSSDSSSSDSFSSGGGSFGGGGSSDSFD